jgi:hypothetical protein
MQWLCITRSTPVHCGVEDVASATATAQQIQPHTLITHISNQDVGLTTLSSYLLSLCSTLYTSPESSGGHIDRTRRKPLTFSLMLSVRSTKPPYTPMFGVLHGTCKASYSCCSVEAITILLPFRRKRLLHIHVQRKTFLLSTRTHITTGRSDE